MQLNASEYKLVPPPPIPLGRGTTVMWHYDKSEDALAWLKPAIADSTTSVGMGGASTLPPVAKVSTSRTM